MSSEHASGHAISSEGNSSDPNCKDQPGYVSNDPGDHESAARAAEASCEDTVVTQNASEDSQMSPDISLSSQRTLRYCDVEPGAHDTSHDSSDSIETLSEPPARDTHLELNNKILEQLSLTCQNLKNSVESRQRVERERRKNKSPLEDTDGDFVSSGDSHEVISDSGSGKVRPETLSLPRPLQGLEREQREKGSRKKGKIESNANPSYEVAASSRLEERGACCVDSENVSSSLPSGTIVRKGDMISFVADNLEEMIKLSSPSAHQDSGGTGSRRSSVRSTVSQVSASSTTSFATSSGPSRSSASRSPSSSLFQQSPDDIPPIDAAAVVELETHARRVADSLDHMMGNIGNNLHKMSAITIGCEDAYKRSVDITCDSVDASIKSMYALMAKCEELSTAMEPVSHLATQIKEIKRILDLFEAQLSDK